jgi:hypothetical protein
MSIADVHDVDKGLKLFTAVGYQVSIQVLPVAMKVKM